MDGVRERIAAFLSAHTTLTLATVDAAGFPAAAAVFYAHDDDLNLYFLSETTTQHGTNLAAKPRVAGTIHADGQDWRTLRGLQVRGVAGPVPADKVVHAGATFARKFVFMAGLLAGAGGPAALVGPLAKAHFYVLRPEWFRLTDNTVRFGFKEEWVDHEPTA